ncbi:MAG: Pullulanase precursor [Pseudomonadota bacterium]|jgi:pullulanase/glycogen debranching enzyme
MPRFTFVSMRAAPRYLAMALLPLASVSMANGTAQEKHLSMCDAPLGHQLLQANALKLPAAAAWLNGTQIQWPEGAMPSAQATGAWRLLASQSGALQVQIGQNASGQDQAWTLQGHADTRQLPALAASELRAIHTAQLVLVQEDPEGRVQKATRVQAANALDSLFAPASLNAQLGANITRAAKGTASTYTTFAVWAPTAHNISVCVYPDALAKASARVSLKRDDTSGVWSVQTPKAPAGSYYRYAVEVFVPGLGRVLNHVNDPYAVSLSANSLRSYVADLNAPHLKPANWDTHRAPQTVKHAADMRIYELHVRDFSIQDITVPAAQRGKYLAFTQKQSQGMRHLNALAQAGMTDLHLLPVFDFATVPEQNCRSSIDAKQALSPERRAQDCFNWGYDPLHFNAPEGSYASDANDAAKRILEFRRMVKALHEAGLRVGMDMVYNHTSASGQHVHSVLDRIVPGYYQRLNAQGEVERSTCCDNTATEHLMMGKLMSDSMLIWAQQYKLDSFRFDLMGHQPRQVMVNIQQRVQQATGRRIDFVGEGWNFGEVANGARFVQASQLSLNGTGIGTFNDRLRDAIRGGGASDAVENLVKMPGFISGQDASKRVAEQIRAGLAGSLRTYRMMTADGSVKALQDIPYGDQPTGYASQPSEVVNYAENHDNLTLFDSLVYKLPPDLPSAERARVQNLASALTAFSQGVAYFHAGMDILRSKSLDGNSYDSGDAFNRLDWSYTSNGFGAATPEQQGSASANALSLSLLQNPKLRPTAQDIAWTRDAFRDLLKIRQSTELLRLKTAQDVQDRLRFLNTEPTADPRMVVGHLDGHGLKDFAELIYFVNAAPQAQHFRTDTLAHKSFELHPVQAAQQAVDQRVRQEARYNKTNGDFEIPARSVVVFVVKGPQP